ncbi:hypothetical protein BDZ90DRAFT_273117 [Jaminaea rosea]|uniref:Transcription factor BYE1 n=1 Tax=Jaminaea rosea TaxID=1569628 RepID=A0A316UZR3_9BASI|nr:hypothetical protein BDZ90DRAFT_273117 [Jaminaea rosea]PWN30797.1 hypothetical protein BDZ90DRAFT_273117 [Jaminaea rosea]
MVWCAGGCDDWFHTACVGLTKKTLDKLDEYRCPDCTEKTGEGSRMNQSGDSNKAMTSKTKIDSASPPAKRKASVSTDDGHKRRKPSHSGASAASSSSKGGSSSSGGRDAQSDAVRAHATSHFAGILKTIFAEAGGAESTSPSSPSPDAAAQIYAQQLEGGVFEAFAEAALGRPSLRTAQKAYKDRFRTLSFSLRDRNEELRARIVAGDLDADTLATLPSEQLANAAMRARTEKAREEALRQSVLKQQQVGPIRKITHKGEVEVERENAGPLSDNFGAKNGGRGAGQSTGVGGLDGGQSPSGVVVADDRSPTPRDEIKPMSASPVRGRQHDASPRVPSFDFSTVWQGGPRNDQSLQDRHQDEDDNQAEEGGKEVSQDERNHQEYEPSKASDDFIDNFLQGISSPQRSTADVEVVASTSENTKGGPSPKSTTPLEDFPLFWRGAITMPDEALTISGTVRQVAGRSMEVHSAGSSFFPSISTVLEGRLPSNVASDYLLQSRLASRTELVVFALEKSFEPEALKKAPAPSPTSPGALDASFDQLLNYLYRRQRYGVLLPSRETKGKVIKDFYIAPLPKDAPIPQWLELLGPVSLLGKEQQRDADMFLLVAVVFKGTLKAKTSTPPVSSSTSLPSQVNRSPAGPLAGTSTSDLQDLLRNLGGGGSGVSPPSQPSSAVDPRSAGSNGCKPSAPPHDPRRADNAAEGQSNDIAAVLGALNSGASEAAASSSSNAGTSSSTAAAALSSVPQADITSLLASNPGLLKSLLSSLGDGGDNSDSSTQAAVPTPPGPPPPRPPMPAAVPGPSSGLPPRPPGPAPTLPSPGVLYGGQVTQWGHLPQAQQGRPPGNGHRPPRH